MKLRTLVGLFARLFILWADSLYPDMRETSDSPGQHIVKYLKAITAWNAAIISLIRTGQLKFRLRSHLILLSSPHLDAIAGFADTLKSRACNVLASKPYQEDVTIFLNSNECRVRLEYNRINNTAIHAEAGLMAVVCAARSSTLPLAIYDKLKDVFSVSAHA